MADRCVRHRQSLELIGRTPWNQQNIRLQGPTHGRNLLSGSDWQHKNVLACRSFFRKCLMGGRLKDWDGLVQRPTKHLCHPGMTSGVIATFTVVLCQLLSIISHCLLIQPIAVFCDHMVCTYRVHYLNQETRLPIINHHSLTLLWTDMPIMLSINTEFWLPHNPHKDFAHPPP